MRHHSLSFRLAAATALSSMLLSLSVPAFAQAPATGLPAIPVAGQDPTAAQPAAADPPARVGRIASIQGGVSFHAGDSDHWEPATLNEPITSANAIWTQPGATTDLDIGQAHLVLDQSSEVSVDQLDDTSFLATAAQGRMFLRVTSMAPGETNTIRTPRGVVTIATPGRYEIVVGDTNTPTLVTVHAGLASVQGPGVNLSLSAGQTAQITGANPFDGLAVAEVSDDFLTAQLQREQPPRPQAVAPPPLVAQMTGADAVEQTGSWDDSPDYGRVWYPPVSAGWVPYREGHWRFVVPWGWTWVDDAPWGFAPFHYGRWAEIHDRWAWIPVERGYEGYDARPVYSPALVTFVGAAAGVAIGVGIAAAVGWIPLGPHEPYHPPYAASSSYQRRVNITNVTNITNTTTNVQNTRFINAGAATMVPASAMQQARPIAAVAQSVPQAQAASLRPMARPNVTPASFTPGVTPSVARNLHLPQQPPPAGLPPRVAPGPALLVRPISSVPGVPQQGAGNGGPALRTSAPTGGPAIPPPPTAPSTAPRAAQVGAPLGNPAGTPPQAPPHPPAAQPGQPPRPPASFQPSSAPTVAPQAGSPAAAQQPHPAGPAPQAQPAPPPRPQPAPQPAPQPRPQPTPELRPQPTPQPRPQPAPQPRPQPAPAPAPAPRPQPMPQPAPRPQPAPHPQPAPPPQPHQQPAHACPNNQKTC